MCLQQVFHSSGEIGEHAAGTPVRGLALVPSSPGMRSAAPPHQTFDFLMRYNVALLQHQPIPLCAGSWVMVSAGAKQVLMAWRLSWTACLAAQPEPGQASSVAAPSQDGEPHSSNAEDRAGSSAASSTSGREDGQEEPILAHRWLSTRPPPKGGLHPRSLAKGCIVRAVEHRQADRASCRTLPCLGMLQHMSSCFCKQPRRGRTEKSMPPANQPFVSAGCAGSWP